MRENHSKAETAMGTPYQFEDVYKRQDGHCVGTIGGGCAEADIYRKALLKIRRMDTEPELCRVDMTGEEAEEEGMVCGGVIEVLMEML